MNKKIFAVVLVALAVLVSGGVAHKPWRVEDGDKELKNGAKAAAAALKADARPTEQNRFKLELVEQALAAVIAQARG